ncbi:MAG: LamG domain-containing protein, partial [Candidatus Edwardsbacteria bacterium]|nr:LamG domain-containing protein [Candidatus Edwardsbacteria bacterium]
ISLDEIPASGLSVSPLISRTLTIGGAIDETDAIQTGIAGGEISFTPEVVTDVYANTLLLLYLDDPAGARTFRDDSGKNIATVCTSTSCPAAGVPGRFGKAVQFTGASNQTLRAMSVAIDPAAYSIAQWFKASCSGCGISGVRTLIGSTPSFDRQIYLSGGNLCVDVVNAGRETICSAGVNYSDGQWHLLAQTIGPAGHRLYVDGKLAASGLKTSSAYTGDSSLVLGAAEQAASTAFSGLLDEVKVFPLVLTPAQVGGLYESWSPVTVAQTGNGVLTSAWSTQVPAGLEGVYEIDLTATDTLGNRNDQRIDWNHWQGEIDTTSPRINIAVSYSGSGSTARTTFSGNAEDLNLTEANLQFPCQNPGITRTYLASRSA